MTKDELMNVHISEDVDPGQTYLIEVFAIFAEEVSIPAVRLVTTKPLPVWSLSYKLIKERLIQLLWQPNEDSIQDSYVIAIYKPGDYSDENIFRTKENYLFYEFSNDLNYEIEVKAISNNTYSRPKKIFFQNDQHKGDIAPYLVIILIIIAIVIVLSIIGFVAFSHYNERLIREICVESIELENL